MIKKVAVGGASPKGGIRMYASEVETRTDLAPAEYTVTPTTLLPITSITVTKLDGTDVTLAIGSGATNEQTLITILRNKLLEIGYEMSEIDGLDSNLPSVKISGEKLTIISELTFKSIDSGGSANFTKKATRKGKATYYKTSGTTADAATITVNGTARAVSGAWTLGTTNAATVKSQIETALSAEITAGTVISVAVVVPAGNTEYQITIVCLTGTTLQFNGVSFAQSGTVSHWVA